MIQVYGSPRAPQPLDVIGKTLTLLFLSASEKQERLQRGEALFSFYRVGVRHAIRTLDVSYARVFVALACCLLAGLAGCGYSSNSLVEGTLSVSPGSISFGAVPVGQTATTKVLLLNATSAPIAVTQVNVSVDFFLNSPTTSCHHQWRLCRQLPDRFQARQQLRLFGPIHRAGFWWQADLCKHDKWSRGWWQWQHSDIHTYSQCR